METVELEDKVLTVREAAPLLRLSVGEVYAMCARREIRHIRHGRLVRLRLSAIQEWTERAEVPVSLLASVKRRV